MVFENFYKKIAASFDETTAPSVEVAQPLPPEPKQIKIEPIAADDSTVGVTVDVESIIKLFGINNYANKLVDVAVKELLQNSFDAVRGAVAGGQIGQGQSLIQINLDPVNKSLSVTDNGLGMSPETVRDVFLCIGASLKENLSADMKSGGFGLAKLAFLFIGDKIRVRTCHRGIKTILETNGNELLTHKAKLHVAPTNEPNGTFVEIIFPDKLEQANGEKKALAFPSKISEIKALNYPLIGDVTIKAKFKGCDETTLPLGSHFDLTDTPLAATIDTKWGRSNVYMPTTPPPFVDRMRVVLSAGLYQFDAPLYGIQNSLILDVRPRVDADDKYYPFNKQREGWSNTVKSDEDGIQNIIELIETLRKNTLLKQAFKDAKAILRHKEKGGDVYSLQDFNITLNEGHDLLEDNVPHFVINEDTITYQNKVLFQKNYSSYKLKQEAAKIMNAYRGDAETTRPLLHSNLNVDIIQETAKAAHVDKQDVINLLGEIGYIAQDFLSKAFQVPGYGTDKFKNPLYGLSLDKTYYGVNTLIPYFGAFLNPGLVKGVSPAAWAHGWLHTMMHENVHWVIRNHFEDFTTSMGTLYGVIEDAYPRLYVNTLDKLTDVATRHVPIIKVLTNIMARDSTQNNSCGLSEGSKQKSGRLNLRRRLLLRQTKRNPSCDC